MRSIDLVSKMERLLKKKYQDLRIFFQFTNFTVKIKPL